jgi:small subunit ribosomal protein S20
MPNHKSAEKRVRQNENRRKINKNNRTALRTALKKFRAAVAAKDVSETQSLLPETVSRIDKAVQKGILHRNAAARHKSRLTRKVNQAGA